MQSSTSSASMIKAATCQMEEAVLCKGVTSRAGKARVVVEIRNYRGQIVHDRRARKGGNWWEIGNTGQSFGI